MRIRRRLVAVMAAALTGVVACTPASDPEPPTPRATTPASPSASTPTATATPTTAPTATPAASSRFDAAFQRFASRIDGEAAIAVVGVNSTGPVWTSGSTRRAVAWSTAKVPLAIAAGDELTGTQRRAITASDNDAAMQLWHHLGDGQRAGTVVTEVLRRFGDDTTEVNHRTTRGGFTPFGQTAWTPAAQTRFAAALPCRREAQRVYGYMQEITAGQRWGLGRLDGAAFKGGWGPEPDGRYLVRQFGVFGSGRDLTAVSIVVWPRSGAFDDGTAQLSQIVDWLSEQELPTGHC